MGNIFSGSEVVEIGVQIEKNGRDFYDGAAKLSKNPEAKEAFRFLKGEEEKHIRTFEDILSKVKKYGPSEAYPGEYFAYLKTLSEDHVFTKKDKGTESAKSIKTDAEGVDLGIKFEKESIAFYEGMKKVVLEGEQKTIDRLIGEEQSHLKRLEHLSEDY